MPGDNVQDRCPAVSERALRGTCKQGRPDTAPRQATIGVQDADAAQLSDRHAVRNGPHLPELVIGDRLDRYVADDVAVHLGNPGLELTGAT